MIGHKRSVRDMKREDVMRRALTSLCLATWCVLAAAAVVQGAVGCSLNDPDRDVQRIFPNASGYKTEYITIKERGGDSLAAEIESRLGDSLDEQYETTDVPYAFYNVLKGKEMIGRVHGVNQKGIFGGMQLILATDMDGVVLEFYYQKISSPEAKRFRSKEFTDQFRGLSLADFYGYSDLPEKERAGSLIGRIADPSEKSPEDFAATLRGIKKNLILLDEFQLGNKYYNLMQEIPEAGNKSCEKEKTDEKTNQSTGDETDAKAANEAENETGEETDD
jgi:hypothetical protein